MSGSNDPFAQAVAGTSVPPALLKRLVGFEDPSGNPTARNPNSGAYGLGQTLPSTAASPGFGVQPLGPMPTASDQLRFSAQYLDARFKSLLGRAPTAQDWADPGKAGAALIAYHGPERDANGIGGVDEAMRVLGLDGVGGTSALGTYSSMVGQNVAAIQAGAADRARQTGPIYDQMKRDIAADRFSFDKAAKDFGPVEKTKPPPIPESDPLKAFGSIAGIFAVLAAGFTRQPALNAMVGLTGAINGARQADESAYKKHYQQWKDQTELAIENHKLQAADMAAALDKMKTDLSTGIAMARAVGAQTDDEIAMKLLASGQVHELADLQMRRQQTVEDIMNRAPAALASMQYMHAQAFGTPEDQQRALDNLTKVTHPTLGTQKPGTDAYITQQTFEQIKREHPEMDDGDAWNQALERVKRSKSADKPPSASAAKEKDDEILAKVQLAKGRGEPVSPEDQRAADEAAERKKVRGETPSGLTPGAQTNMATVYIKTGQMPAGIRNKADFEAVQNEADVKLKKMGLTIDDVIINQAAFKADQSGLTNLTKLYTASSAQEDAAKREFELVRANIPAVAEKVDTQFINKWLQSGETQFGGVQPPKYQAALISALDEYAKVLAGATGTAGSTDASRAQAAQIIPKGATSDQVNGIIDLIDQSMQIKTSAYLRRINEIKTEIGGGAGAQAPVPAEGNARSAAPALPAAAASQLKEGHITTFANGQKWTLENGQPKQVQ